MAEKLGRAAQLQFERQATGFTLNATVPFDVSAKEFATLHDSLIKRIKDLTGCPCLSGQVRVVLEGRFDDVLDVNLDTGQLLGR